MNVQLQRKKKKRSLLDNWISSRGFPLNQYQEKPRGEKRESIRSDKAS